MLHSQPLVVRDFSLSRSKRIDGDRRAHHEQVVDKAVLREALQDAFASQLPYCDITVSMGGRKYQSVIADYEWVVGVNNEVRSACASTLIYRRRSTAHTMHWQGDDFSRTTHHIDIHHVI